MNWNLGPNTGMSTGTIRESLAGAAGAHAEMPAGAKVVEATYEFPYLAHCTMEPLNAVADVRLDRCTVWAGSQGPDRLQTSVAQVLKMPAENVTVNVMLLGGGFGRRSGSDYILEAVDLSQRAKAPVKLLWTKEDDLHNDTYRTISFHSYRGAVRRRWRGGGLEPEGGGGGRTWGAGRARRGDSVRHRRRGDDDTNGSHADTDGVLAIGGGIAILSGERVFY